MVVESDKHDDDSSESARHRRAPGEPGPVSGRPEAGATAGDDAATSEVTAGAAAQAGPVATPGDEAEVPSTGGTVGNADTRGVDGTPAGDAAGASTGGPGDDGAAHEDGEDDEPEKKNSWLKDLGIVVAVVLVLMFICTQFFFRQYVVPSESMEATLHGCPGCTNDRIVIDKFTNFFSDPEPGDVIVFKAPNEDWNENWQSPRSGNPLVHRAQDVLSWFALAPPNENNLVKRVIATGGQTIECTNEDGRGLTVDGKQLDEPYIDQSLQRAEGMPDVCWGIEFGPVTVPDNSYFVMGDNRMNSMDSRFHLGDGNNGAVPRDDVRGKVRFIIYPFNRMGGVGSDNPQG